MIQKKLSKTLLAQRRAQTSKHLLKQHNIKPKKYLGQNFLICQNPIEKIIKAANIKPTDTVIEIGPGLGTITIALAQKAKQVIAVEKDKNLSMALAQILKQLNIKNAQVITGDILKISPADLSSTIRGPSSGVNYKVAANLPYNIASAVVMKFLEAGIAAKAPDQPLHAPQPPQIIAVMLQKEVAQRMLAKPPKTNKLAVFCQLLAELKIISYIPKSCFYPRPKVDSAIIQIIPQSLPMPPTAGASRQTFYQQICKIINAGFCQPRKQLINNLSTQLKLPRQTTQQWLQKNKIRPSQRAETLSTSQWHKLTTSFPSPPSSSFSNSH